MVTVSKADIYRKRGVYFYDTKQDKGSVQPKAATPFTMSGRARHYCICNIVMHFAVALRFS